MKDNASKTQFFCAFVFQSFLMVRTTNFRMQKTIPVLRCFAKGLAPLPAPCGGAEVSPVMRDVPRRGQLTQRRSPPGQRPSSSSSPSRGTSALASASAACRVLIPRAEPHWTRSEWVGWGTITIYLSKPPVMSPDKTTHTLHTFSLAPCAALQPTIVTINGSSQWFSYEFTSDPIFLCFLLWIGSRGEGFTRKRQLFCHPCSELFTSPFCSYSLSSPLSLSLSLSLDSLSPSLSPSLSLSPLSHTHTHTHFSLTVSLPLFLSLSLSLSVCLPLLSSPLAGFVQKKSSFKF